MVNEGTVGNRMGRKDLKIRGWLLATSGQLKCQWLFDFYS